MSLEDLEQTAITQIIKLLQRKSPLMLNEILKGLRSSQQPVYNAINRLKDLGLIEENLQERPLRRLFSLTDRGRRVALKLTEVESILGEASKTGT